MSVLKELIYSLDNKKDIKIQIPNKKSLILRGRMNESILYIVESLLSSDFTGNNYEIDLAHGVKYYKKSEKASIYFNEGSLKGEFYSVKTEGKVPKIHCIRCLDDFTVRSFVVTDGVSPYESIYYNMHDYSPVISDFKWLRLINIVNDFLGKEFAFLSNDKQLYFDLSSQCEYSVEVQKFIYTLIAECFLTDKNFHRFLLLSDLDFLEEKQQVKLLELLDNIKGHSLTLSCANIQPCNVSSNSALSFLNV